VILGFFLVLVGAVALTLGSLGATAVLVAPWARRVRGHFTTAMMAGVDIGAAIAVLVAAVRGDTAIAAGAAFGAIALSTALGLGTTLLLGARSLDAPGPAALLVPVAGLLIAAIVLHDLEITRPEGVALILLYVLAVSALSRQGWEPRSLELRLPGTGTGERATPSWAWGALGIALVVAGAYILVAGSRRVADVSGLTPGFAGAALVGALAVAARAGAEAVRTSQGALDLGSGSLLPTVLAFSTGVPGLAALIHPLVLDTGVTTVFLAASILSCMAATVLLARGRAGRVLGLFLLVGYAGWLVFAARH
jgi:cation:H+ antiporter